MERDERELVARAKAGDRRAFDELTRMYKDKMFALTYRMCGDRETALDLLQDTFLSAFKSIRNFRGEAGFSSWLYRIASNKAINYLRRKKLLSFTSLGENPANEPSYIMDDTVQNKELNQAMVQAVESLPPKQKLIFNLRFYEQMQFAEIAGIMKRSQSTVKTSYQKAIEKLRKKLGDFR
jgi:RNA polymerase sigma-70 factor (ECF subfamily)